MKLKITTLLILITSIAFGQKPSSIEVRYFEDSLSSEIENISLFHLNHSLYMNAFKVGDIYPDVSSEELKFMSSTLIKELKNGKRVQFLIKTNQKERYRLAIFISSNNGQKRIVYLTNFNPKSRKFKKEVKGDYYATSDDIIKSTIIDEKYTFPLSKQSEFETKKDYLSLIQMNIFNGNIEKGQMDRLFVKAFENTTINKNETIWLKSYYHLSLGELKEAQANLNKLDKNLAKLSDEKQSAWKPSVDVLRVELKLMKLIEE